MHASCGYLFCMRIRIDSFPENDSENVLYYTVRLSNADLCLPPPMYFHMETDSSPFISQNMAASLHL